jgi:hypothetical protein
MTRRELFCVAAAPAATWPSQVVVPVHHLLDRRAKCTPEQMRGFWSGMWPEAVRDLGYCGVVLESCVSSGEVRRSPGGRPVFVGLEAGVINLVITDEIPMNWGKGRGLSGVTTRYEGYHLCMIALNHAHGHQVPLLSVNTCIHELLHVLLQDVFETRPKGMRGDAREFRVDLYATRLWLFHDGGPIQDSARAYIGRLRSGIH